MLHGLDGEGAWVQFALRFVEKGYPVIAAGACGAGAEEAAQAGVELVEADGEGALRAGVARFAENPRGSAGFVAADLRGGYSPADVERVAGAFGEHPDRFVIAARERNRRMGAQAEWVRRTAALFFAAVHGRRVRDPWAGLWAAPAGLAPGLLEMAGGGDRLGFNMLLDLQRRGVKAVSVPVMAPFSLDGARLRARAADLPRILLLPLKYISASVLTFLADYGVFTLFGYVLTPDRLNLSIILGRLAGATVSYLLNRSLVFRGRSSSWRGELTSALKFALLAAFNCFVALSAMNFLIDTFHLYAFVTKPIADVLLFFLSFMIQRDFIFRPDRGRGEGR